jgi:hypothetical protein
MAREPAARSREIAAELRNQSEACAFVNPRLSDRLTEMAGAVERIHESIDRFAAIEGIADLLALHKKFTFCWMAKFNRLLGAFWMDALRGSDSTRRDTLRRALKVLQDVYVAVYLIKKGVSGDFEQWMTKIEENPLLCDNNFHEFLDERAHFAALNDDPSAEAVAQMATYIRHTCKSASAIKHLRESPPSEEYVSLRLPSLPDQAELWFIVNKKVSMAMMEIAQEVSRGAETLETGIKNTLRVVPSAGNESQQAADTFYTAAFLEHLLRVAKDDVRRQTIEHYRSLAETGHWSSAEARATYVLRYSKALLDHWRSLADPLSGLQDGTTLISDALPSIDVSMSPRLTRDLFFSRARLLENIGMWLSGAYQSAADDYARGLAVPKVAHELEARGSALTDYANTLTRIPSSPGCK